MGLSDGERYRNVAHIISDLYGLQRFKDYHHKALNPLLDRLWFDFLRETSNGMHWIMGSESGASHLGECSLLAVEFKAALHVEDHEEWSNAPSYWAIHYKPHAEDLLDSGSEEARIWRIIRLIESYFYSANRYRDKFGKRLKAVTRTICELRGLCHGLLKTDRRFALAWMMQHILDRCFSYRDDDLLNICGAAFNWQHDLRVQGQDAQEIGETFKQFQFAEMTTHDKLCVLLRWTGRRFHYEHQHRDLMIRVRAWNLDILNGLGVALSNRLSREDVVAEVSANAATFRADGWVDETEIAALCAQSRKAHEEYEKDSRQNYEIYCHLTEQSSRSDS